MKSSVAILLDFKTCVSVPLSDAAASCDTLLNLQVYCDAEHYVHAAVSCDVVGEPTAWAGASPPMVEHADGYTVFKPSDPSRVPIRILVTKAPHELPHRLLITVGPLAVDAETLTCGALAFAALMPPPRRALSNVVNLYGSPWQDRPSSALGLACTGSPRSPDGRALTSVLRRYDLPCPSSLYEHTALAGLEDIACLPPSAVDAYCDAGTPE